MQVQQADNQADEKLDRMRLETQHTTEKKKEAHYWKKRYIYK